jgi:hypothetical protein
VTGGLAAVCAIYGEYDLIPPVPDGFDDCVLVTDRPVRTGWRNVVEGSGLPPRLAAKRPKARPDLYTDCQVSVWLDGTAHVRDHRFAELALRLVEEHELVVWDHPEDRRCLLEEAQHCFDWPKYRDTPLREQAGFYLAQGMPLGFGLWALGSIARRHTERMAAFGDAWLAEMEAWTIQDQVSLPYLIWRHGINIGTFGPHQLDNDLVDWVPHAEDIRNHRIQVLDLESQIIHLEADVDQLRVALDNANLRLHRLQSRKVVRAALFVAGLLRPLLAKRSSPTEISDGSSEGDHIKG